jgi:hypothetical protein
VPEFDQKGELMKQSSLQPSIFIISQILFFCVISLAFAAPLFAQTEVKQTITKNATLEETWGIEILGIRSTAANYMLDFRYRVLDAEKAKPLFRRKARPQVIDQTSGAKVGVFSSPKTGPMRSSDTPQVDRNYFIMFANPGRYIEVGSKVTVVIDDFKVENMTVQ